MRKKRADKKSRDYSITEEGAFIVIAVIAFIIFATGMLSVLGDVRFLIVGTEAANGKIVFCQMERYYKGGTYCEATISFNTQSGQHITFEAPADNSNPGDTVAVQYHPNNPEEARIDTVLGDLTWAGIGLGLLLVDLCIFWYWKRRSTREYVLKHKGRSTRARYSGKNLHSGKQRAS